jgi:outer membrane protein
MNRAPIVLSSLALLGVLILAILQFRGKNSTSSSSTTSSTMPASGLRVAYVDIDTFESRYVSLKNKKQEFAARQSAMEAELQQAQEQMQRDYNDLQKRSQAGTLSQTEGEAAAKRLKQMDQTLQVKSQTMGTQLKKELDAFNEELHDRMDSFLTEYTKDKHFSYVLSYSRSNPVILYADKGLNVTEDVIKGMNERSGKDTVKAHK